MQVTAAPVSLPTASVAPPAANTRVANSTTALPETQGSASFAPVSAVELAPSVRSSDTYSPAVNKTVSEPVQEQSDSSDGIEQAVTEEMPPAESQGVEAQSSEARDAITAEQEQRSAELALIQQLKQTDAEVRAHEQAHSAVGGNLAGAASFSYRSGPDGVRYAVAGEVSIDVGKVAGDPQATLDKMERVRRAALAPAEPSAQDRQVAAQAAQLAAEAQAEIVAEQREISRLQSNVADDQRQEARIELQEAREKQQAAEEKAKEEEEGTISAAERFAEYNAKVRRINETLLRISQPAPVSAGQLLNDIA